MYVYIYVCIYYIFYIYTLIYIYIYVIWHLRIFSTMYIYIYPVNWWAILSRSIRLLVPHKHTSYHLQEIGLIKGMGHICFILQEKLDNSSMPLARVSWQTIQVLQTCSRFFCCEVLQFKSSTLPNKVGKLQTLERSRDCMLQNLDNFFHHLEVSRIRSISFRAATFSFSPAENFNAELATTAAFENWCRPCWTIFNGQLKIVLRRRLNQTT